MKNKMTDLIGRLEHRSVPDDETAQKMLLEGEFQKCP
jgi:hypothetical protein